MKTFPSTLRIPYQPLPPEVMPGRMKRRCAWCGADLGDKPCPQEQDGQTTSSICGPCHDSLLVAWLGGEG